MVTSVCFAMHATRKAPYGFIIFRTKRLFNNKVLSENHYYLYQCLNRLGYRELYLRRRLFDDVHLYGLYVELGDDLVYHPYTLNFLHLLDGHLLEVDLLLDLHYRLMYLDVILQNKQYFFNTNYVVTYMSTRRRQAFE